ncbi:MAG: TonB-dependent receptor [Chitinophagales bacterium]|nr:TonB-dependent receptor [Chitinophagales bacterium]MDW8419560.1 TonB-dependent receptor [Chitinophagales bacterium]
MLTIRKLCISLLLCSVCNVVIGQTATVQGTVSDGKTGEPLESANVLQPPTNGTTTNEKGFYSLTVKPGQVMLVFSYIGSTPDTQYLFIKANETKTLNVKLGGGPLELQQVVIGENKIGTKVQKLTTSVDVMRPRILEANNITNVQNAVLKAPGVTVLDGQMSIRGGSGYAYGSGSRVMLVVDEMPLMSADRGEIKWALIPMENVEQLEIMKGASTMQYGASALNGVLNVTTGYARDTPETKFTFFYEGVGRPPVDTFRWWKRDGSFLNAPNTAGMSFLHKQKLGDVDLVAGGMLHGMQSHLKDDYDHFVRFNGKLRWQPQKLRRLTLELNSTLLYRTNGFQFFWKDRGTPYIPANGVSIQDRYFYAVIDPKFRFVDKKNNQHKLYTRLFRQYYYEGRNGPHFWIFGVDYQFRRDFGRLFRLLMGVRNEHWWVKDGTLGNHDVDFGGGFLQGEFNYKFINLTVGVREEYMRLDSIFTPTIPVFRIGANFEIKKFNYIRASFGQAFRMPSLAERFVDYDLVSIRIIPNYDLRPERGFTAEIGYKRSVKISNWLGYLDAVAFWTEFKDMIEFTFGTRYTPEEGLYPYFQSQNVNYVRIFGWEFSGYGEGRFGPVDLTTLFGYTYFYGADLNDTTFGAGRENARIGGFFKNVFTKFILPTAQDDYTWDSLTAGMLKYRNNHQFKADFDFRLYDRYRLGTSVQYYSYMNRVDKIFEIFIKGAAEERQLRRNKGDVAWDLRAGYDFNRNIAVNLLVKNVLNSNYAFRFARPGAPRSYTIQMIINFGRQSPGLSQSMQNNLQRM